MTDKTIFLLKFSNLRARNMFYRGRTQLSAHSRVWINEDLCKEKESLAYEARLRYKGYKIVRCWTFNGEVYIQLNEGADPLKISKMSDFPECTKLDPETPRPRPPPPHRGFRGEQGRYKGRGRGRGTMNPEGPAHPGVSMMPETNSQDLAVPTNLST